MSEKIKVLLSEEEVDAELSRSQKDQQGLCRKGNTSDLCFKGWRILYL